MEITHPELLRDRISAHGFPDKLGKLGWPIGLCEGGRLNNFQRLASESKFWTQARPNLKAGTATRTPKIPPVAARIRPQVCSVCSTLIWETS